MGTETDADRAVESVTRYCAAMEYGVLVRKNALSYVKKELQRGVPGLRASIRAKIYADDLHRARNAL